MPQHWLNAFAAYSGRIYMLQGRKKLKGWPGPSDSPVGGCTMQMGREGFLRRFVS